jgi:hypothetical protein
MASPDLPLIDRGIRSLYRSAVKAFDRSAQKKASRSRTPIVLETGLNLRPAAAVAAPPVRIVHPPNPIVGTPVDLNTAMGYPSDPAIALYPDTDRQKDDEYVMSAPEFLEDRATRTRLLETGLNLRPDAAPIVFAEDRATRFEPPPVAEDTAATLISKGYDDVPLLEDRLTRFQPAPEVVLAEDRATRYRPGEERTDPRAYTTGIIAEPNVIGEPLVVPDRNPNDPSESSIVKFLTKKGRNPRTGELPPLTPEEEDARELQRMRAHNRWLNAPEQGPPMPPPTPDTKFAEDRATRFRPEDLVLPPDPNKPAEQPAVVPGTAVEAPKIDATELTGAAGLPGTTTETATGALSLDAYIEKMKQAYPDLDFTNPKQAEADANARRDLDRTAMLAQLSLAAGMVKGAGTMWEGLGAGFESAAGTYDKGFQKYQQALQDSADRYGKQMEAQMTYDTARRQAALKMYTDAEAQAREDQRTLFTERNKREWESYKLQQETKKEGLKLSHEDIRNYFTKALKPLEPSADDATADPVEVERKAKLYKQTLAAMQESLLRGEIVAAGDEDVDVAD